MRHHIQWDPSTPRYNTATNMYSWTGLKMKVQSVSVIDETHGVELQIPHWKRARIDLSSGPQEGIAYSSFILPNSLTIQIFTALPTINMASQ